jgi:hypothetical protein
MFLLQPFAKKQPENFCQNAALPALPKLHHSAALLQTQNSAQMLNYCPLLHIPSSTLPSTLSSSLLKALSCFEATFARRTSEHVGTVKYFYSLCNNIK